MRKAVLKPVFLEQLSEVGDVAGRQPEGVQFRQFGVGGDPGQTGLQPGEGFAQHPHPRSLPGVGCVPLGLTRVPVRRPGDPALLLDPPLLRAVIVQLLIRVPAGVVAGDFARRPLQGRGGGRSSGTRLVVLGVARNRAGGHVAAPPVLRDGRTGDPSGTLALLQLCSQWWIFNSDPYRLSAQLKVRRQQMTVGAVGGQVWKQEPSENLRRPSFLCYPSNLRVQDLASVQFFFPELFSSHFHSKSHWPHETTTRPVLLH